MSNETNPLKDAMDAIAALPVTPMPAVPPDATNIYSAMLWLYRRLPRGYANPPHIDQAVKLAAAAAGSDPAEFLAERAAGVPAHPAGAVHQFRTKGASDWYDGHPDNDDGGGPYEVRTLYAAPVAAPVAGQEPVLWHDASAAPHEDQGSLQTSQGESRQIAILGSTKGPFGSFTTPLFAAPVPAASVHDKQEQEYIGTRLRRVAKAAGVTVDYGDDAAYYAGAFSILGDIARALDKTAAKQPDSGRDAALEEAARAVESHELAEKLVRMTMSNPVGHAISLTRTIAAAIRALAAHPANVAQVGELSTASVLEQAAQACDQQADGTNGPYRSACLQCADAVRALRDAAKAAT